MQAVSIKQYTEKRQWMNEKKIYIAHLKAYKCMLKLPRLAEN